MESKLAANLAAKFQIVPNICLCDFTPYMPPPMILPRRRRFEKNGGVQHWQLLL